MAYINPRRRRTREKLKNALFELALTNGGHKLSVQAVRRQADIGHTTFYRHYKGLDDLLGSYLFPAFAELRQRIAQQRTLYDESCALFHFIKDYQDTYRLYLSLPKSNAVRQAIDQADRDLLDARWERCEQTEVPFEMSVQIIEALIARLIHLYLENLDAFTAEQMASMYYDLVLKMAMNTMKLRDGWVVAPKS